MLTSRLYCARPATDRHNADYCQINRPTSFSENSLWSLQTGEGPGQSERRRGGARNVRARSGVTPSNSCPDPELETVSRPPLAPIGSDPARPLGR
ncbi:hypothetical protein EYF80_038395 [Liparis tanakae]|uniref:Uncharacterized protein n=1 Tax=Liparis tanakae TaxID=230148 RepID=A0A4Z2GFJ4_9TELE|nr:hypothetical protein EYF80_038395 [Liparis tanakae]